MPDSLVKPKGERCDERSRHLIWIFVAALSLAFPESPSFAQPKRSGRRDRDFVAERTPSNWNQEFQRATVLYRTTEAPGTIIVHTAERYLYVVQGNGRAHALRHRGRPRRLPVVRVC